MTDEITTGLGNTPEAEQDEIDSLGLDDWIYIFDNPDVAYNSDLLTKMPEGIKVLLSGYGRIVP
jgi:hypothetical protein